MDLIKSIQIFETVAQEQSFSRAAEKLNLVPSAVSRQVSELEKWLNVRLINRTTRSFHLTDEGRRCLQKMTHISELIAELRTADKGSNTLSGRIKITTPVMLGQLDVSRFLSQFKEAHPDVSISLTLMNRKVDLVEEGYDIAIRAGHLTDSNLYARQVGETAFKTVVSPSYLKKAPPLAHPKDLHQHDCIINSAIANPRRWSYSVNGTNKIYKINGSIEINDSTCILGFVKAGQGVGRLPDNYIKRALQAGEVIEVLSDFRPAPLPIHILYPSNRLMSGTVRALVEYLIECFSQDH